MNKLDRSIKYAKKALKLAKSYKHKINKSNNYILLFSVDIWNQTEQGESSFDGSNVVEDRYYQPRYFVLSQDLCNNNDYIIDNPTYTSVLIDKECHFPKSFLEDKQLDYQKDIASKLTSLYDTMPVVLSLPRFKHLFHSF